MAAGPSGRARALAACGVLLLVALFAWNKLAAGSGGVLPSQGGLVFLGLSYLVLKAAAAFVQVQQYLAEAAIVGDGRFPRYIRKTALQVFHHL